MRRRLFQPMSTILAILVLGLSLATTVGADSVSEGTYEGTYCEAVRPMMRI